MMRKRVVVIALAALPLLGGCRKKQGEGESSTPAGQAAAGASTPHPATKAKEAAVRRYPDLANKDTLFNRTFRALYEDRKKTDPQFLTTEDWPLVLAARVGEILHVRPKNAEPR